MGGSGCVPITLVISAGDVGGPPFPFPLPAPGPVSAMPAKAEARIAELGNNGPLPKGAEEGGTTCAAIEALNPGGGTTSAGRPPAGGGPITLGVCPRTSWLVGPTPRAVIRAETALASPWAAVQIPPGAVAPNCGT